MSQNLGSNDGSLASFKGDIIADTDAPLLSTQSTGGQSYALGSSLSAGIYTMVQNGTFKATPPDPDSVIAEPENALPYFSLESNYVSGSQITATSVEDSTVASGRKIRFTIPAGTAVGQYLRFVRYVAVPGSVARTFTYQPRSAWKSTSSTTEVWATHQSQFYQNDIATTTGTSETRTATLTTITASTWAYELYANPNSLPSIPSDAAFIRVAVGVLVNTLTTSSWTVDLHEVRIDHGSIQQLITDQTDPARYGYASTYMNSGRLDTRSNETGVVGSSPIISIYSKQGSIGLDASPSGVAQTITAASRAGSTVTITTSANHDLEVLYWVTVAGLSGAAGTSMNGTFQVLSKTATQFTYTAAGTAGSATVTGATVKTAPAQGNILLTTATNGNVIVNPGGISVTGNADFSSSATVGGQLNVSGDIDIGVSDTSTAGAIVFKGGNGGSIRAFSASAGNDSIGVYNTSGSAYTALVALGFYPNQGTANLSHNGTNFTMNDTVAVTGNITATGNMTATGSVTGSTLSTSGNVSTNGAGLFHDTPTGVTLASGSTVGRTALWTLNSGTQYNLQRWTSTSTATLKKNIRETELAPDQIYNIDLVDFEYDLEKFAELYPHINVEATGTQRGVIWEQIADVIPEAAVQGYGPGDPPTIDWEALYFGALVAIKDLNERLKALESK